MFYELSIMKNKLVVKSNQVIEASYRLSIIEQRVVLSAIAKIPKQVEVSDNEIYTVSVQDLKSLGIHEKTAYRDLKDAVSRLYERSISLDDGKLTKIRWVQRVDFSDSKSEIAIRFSKDILPFISNVKANFTQYLLSEVARMQSAYSIRLYEMLNQYKSKGERSITIDDLRAMLDIGQRYKTTGNLMAWVVEPAIKEINELTELNITVSAKKTGRKYSHLEFIIKQKAKPKKDSAKIERDEKTGDLFSIGGLSDAQLARITRNEQFKKDYGDMVSPNSLANTDAQEWTKEMVKRLKSTPELFTKRDIKEYLS